MSGSFAQPAVLASAGGSIVPTMILTSPSSGPRRHTLAALADTFDRPVITRSSKETSSPDFPLLWGILTFFLSFVPYIGLVLAVTPAVVLALAEFGLDRALLVIAGVIVINVLAENVLSPLMMGRGLNLSPTIVFLSFIIWAWLLGGPGAFLALPITLFVAVMLDTFPETRWLASLIGVADTGTSAEDGDHRTLRPGRPNMRPEKAIRIDTSTGGRSRG